MSEHIRKNLNNMVKQLAERTKNNELDWKDVPREYYGRVLDRTAVFNKRELYYSKGKGGLAIIGKFDERIYTDVDEYYTQDHFFLTICDQNFENPIPFADNDNDLPGGFALALSRLHRLVQLEKHNINERLENWFD